jgi:hypothetical protein
VFNDICVHANGFVSFGVAVPALLTSGTPVAGSTMRSMAGTCGVNANVARVWLCCAPCAVLTPH